MKVRDGVGVSVGNVVGETSILNRGQLSSSSMYTDTIAMNTLNRVISSVMHPRSSSIEAQIHTILVHNMLLLLLQLCDCVHRQIFWSQKLSSSSTQVESVHEFRHVLPARHLSYRINDLRLDSTYLVQV